MEKARSERDDNQNVRLWLNQITPDNYDKKESELRGLMFGDRKAKDEEGYVEDKDYEVDTDKLSLVV